MGPGSLACTNWGSGTLSCSNSGSDSLSCSNSGTLSYSGSDFGVSTVYGLRRTATDFYPVLRGIYVVRHTDTLCVRRTFGPLWVVRCTIDA